MLLLLFRTRLRERALQQDSLRRLLLRLELLILAVVGMALSYALAENASITDSLWLTWQTVTTVGYGDVPPKTAWGRTGVMGFGLAAILLLPFIVSSAVEYREDMRTRRRLGMENNPFTNGYVFINMRNPDHILTFVRQLRFVEKNAPICIIDSKMTQLPEEASSLANIHFVQGSLLDYSTYERAGVTANKAVIIFPTDPSDSASDATTKVVAEMILEIVPESTRVIHFLVDPDNERLLSSCRSVSIYTGLEIFAAIQECTDPGSAEVIETLLSNTHGANPNTYTPRHIVGWTWGDLLTLSAAASQAVNAPVNPFALIKKGCHPEACPPMAAVIEAGDTISLIAHSNFNYPHFEEALIKLKTR